MSEDRWQPQTGEEWFSRQNTRVSMLERQAGRRGSGTSGGTISSVTDGMVYLTYPSGSDTYGPFPFATGYIPTPGDQVWTIGSGENTVVGGAVSSWHPLPVVNPSVYMTYNSRMAQTAWVQPGYAVRNGFAQISGMITLLNNADGTLLFTLPEGARPDTDRIFYVSNSDTMRGIVVRTDGRVQLRQGFVADSFVSLDSIMFPVAGRAVWTEIDPQGTVGSTHQFQNGWSDFTPGGGGYGRAAYWQDEFGVLWLRGLVSGGTATDNAAIFTTPFDFVKQQHLACVSRDLLGGVGAGITGRRDTVNFKPPSANTWVSLAGLTLQTSTSLARTDWERLGTHFNLGQSWGQFGDANLFTVPAKWLRPDGIQFFSGLMSGGTIGAGIVTGMNDRAQRNQHRSRLYPTVSNQALGRLDVSGMGPEWGAVRHPIGNTGWFSWDGIKYIPGNPS